MKEIANTKGIVFKSFAYGESSMIAEIYTEHYGLRSFIINGVRSKKSYGKAHMYHPGQLLEITAYFHEADKLHRIKDVSYDRIFTRINSDVISSSVASFLIEVCSKSIREREANEALFLFLYSRFIALDQLESGLTPFYLRFLVELTEYLGFYPMNNYTPLRPIFDMVEGNFVTQASFGHQQLSVTESLLWLRLISLQDMTFTKQERDLLVDKLVAYYAIHLSDFKGVKSLDVLRAVLG